MSELDIPTAVELALELVGQGVVIGEVNSARNLRWANSGLTTNGDTIDQSLAIAAIVETKQGVSSGIASGQVRSRDDIEKLVQASIASAHAAGPAPDAAPLAQGPIHTSFNDGAEISNNDELAEIASSLGEVMPQGDFFGYAEHSIDTTYVATSAGTRMRFSQPTSRFELCAKSPDRTRSAWSGQGGTSLHNVDVSKHSSRVLRGLEHQLNQLEIEPGQQTVTLSPSAVADLLIYLLWTASAREAHEGRSVFSNPLGGTRIGEKLSPRKLNVFTDPHVVGLETHDMVINLGSSSMSSSFDTGLPIAHVDVIRDGVLTSLASSRFAAKEAGLPFTPFADNIVVTDTDGAGDLDELAVRMRDGLLITCLWYIREVDPQSLLLTGLTRDGVYVVRNGEIVGAANNFRFNESPVGMLGRIIDAGSAVNCLPREWGDYFPRAQVAPMTIEKFNLSTRSDAI